MPNTSAGAKLPTLSSRGVSGWVEALPAAPSYGGIIVAQAEIGLIGLGVMGSNLALNIAEKGNTIAVFNRTVARTKEFYEEAGDLKGRIVPCETIEEFVAAIRPPRPSSS